MSLVESNYKNQIAIVGFFTMDDICPILAVFFIELSKANSAMSYCANPVRIHHVLS